MCETPSAEGLDALNLLSLPEDLIISIASLLEDRDVYGLEFTSKRLYTALTMSCRTWPNERQLDLGARFGVSTPSPEALRWLQKHIRRYKRIVCNYCNASMLHELYKPDRKSAKASSLPFPLATCAPSAELILIVPPDEGDKFLAASSSSFPCGLGPSRFWADLKLHLTELDLLLYKRDKLQDLETLNAMLALQSLRISYQQQMHLGYHNLQSQDHTNFEMRLALALPYLITLELYALERGDVILTCPMLAEARFLLASSLRIKVEDAALASLVFAGCERVELVDSRTEDHFLGIQSLEVSSSGELGRHLIEGIGQMSRLQKFAYRSFPAACMPRSFPPSLQHLKLYPFEWGRFLPRGLKELPELETFEFSPNKLHHSLASRPFRELKKHLPIDSLVRSEFTCKDYISMTPYGTRFVHQGLLEKA